MKHKRRLSSTEEFDIMKMVLDKFLWLATFLMGWGLYTTFVGDISTAIYQMAAGAVIFIVFAAIIIREFEMVR